MIRLKYLKTKPKNDVCCVGVHVQHATFFLAVASLIGSCLLIYVDIMNFGRTTIVFGDLFSYVYFTLWNKIYYHVAIDIFTNTLWALSSIILLCGNLRLNASFYWPYIGIVYVNICLCIIKSPLFLLSAVSVFRDQIEEVPKAARVSTCFQIILLICLNFMILITNWFSVGVVTRALQFLLRHRQVQTKSMQMEIKQCVLHLDGYHAPLDF